MSDTNPSQFIIYQSEDGQTRLDVRFVDETAWLTQALMAELFGTSKHNIGQGEIIQQLGLPREATNQAIDMEAMAKALVREMKGNI